jgi:adenine-specific DNA-methyltransferase
VDKLVPDARGRVTRTKFRGGTRFEPLLDRARTMRREPTDAERLLWARLRNRQLGGLKFRRQHPFGGYILDFYCESVPLAVEVDGGQHFSAEGLASDAARSAYLANAGVVVLRFTDSEVLNDPPTVLDAIAHAADLPP